MTPSARSTKYLRGMGCIVCRVEQRLPIPGKFITRDAFNIGDLLAAAQFACGQFAERLIKMFVLWTRRSVRCDHLVVGVIQSVVLKRCWKSALTCCTRHQLSPPRFRLATSDGEGQSIRKLV